MADIKWSTFPSFVSPGAGDVLVGLHAGANTKFTGLTIPFSPTVGGTGIANAVGSTITLGAALTTSGAFASTFTMTGVTTVTFPTSGTLATTTNIPAGVVVLSPSANQTILNAYNLVMQTGSLVAPTILPGNLSLTANTISSTNSNGSIKLIPNGSGNTQGIMLLGYPTAIGADTSSILQASAVQKAAVFSWATYWNANAGSQIYLNASASEVPGVYSAVSNARLLGQLVFRGDDGTAFTVGATISATTSAAISAGIVPTDLKFSTANASGVTTLAMTISKAQIVALANALPVSSGGTNLTSTTANQLLYSSAANTISGLATANNGILITSSAGVPSISSTLPATVQGNITALGTIAQNLILTVPAAAYRYIAASANNDGVMLFQNGTGSSAFGGAYALFGSTHATFPGWTKAAISAQVGSKFAINSAGLANAVDVFTCDRNGNVVANSGVTSGGTTNPFNGLFKALPSGATSGFLAIEAVSNSTGDFSTTIHNASSQAQTQVVTIPDAGAATANFLLNTANGTANNLAYYAASGSVISSLATANSGLLVTSASGVPSISSTLPSAVQLNITQLGNIAQSIFYTNPGAAGTRYLAITGASNTFDGQMILQAGGGSASYGGGLVLYGNSHATKPGSISAGISSGSGGSFRVNTQGLSAGTDVFTVSSAGNVVANGSVTTTQAIISKVNGTESANAVTASGGAGYITTSALTTAGAGSYAITWTNTLITATSVIQLQVMGGTNTTKNISFTVTAGSGTSTLTIFNNTLATALNGTILIGYSLL